MRKKLLSAVSICAVVLFVSASLNTTVGYQTIQASDQKVIKEEVDQKELLFQTIIDMANNKEVHRVILGSELTGKRFFDSGVKFSVFSPPVLTEKFLKRMYTMGVILSKTINKSKMHSLLERYPENNQEIQKEITAVIEKDVNLKSEMTQLSSSACNCENDSANQWNFPIICNLLFPLVFAAIMMRFGYFISPSPYAVILGIIGLIILNILEPIGNALHCFWYPY